MARSAKSVLAIPSSSRRVVSSLKPATRKLLARFRSRREGRLPRGHYDRLELAGYLASNSREKVLARLVSLGMATVMMPKNPR